MDEEKKLNYNELLNLNAHLITKNKQLEEELVRRNDYIADLSHRLRTPISVIFGMTTLAKNQKADQHMIADCITKIDFSTHMLLNTVNEILELDAVRKGNLIIHNSCFDFKLLVSSVSSVCSAECIDRDIYYDVLLSGVTEESLVGDSVHLNRALMILLMRAIEATDAGGHIKFRITQRDINKRSVQIQFCILDTGTALTQEEIERYTNEDENSNITLAKQLCSLMDGTFAFESKKGVGTTFSMTFTFGINSAAEIITQDFFDTYRVLLVTKDEQTLTNVVEVLKRIGTECVFVEDSEKATVALLEASTMNKDFDLCLVDWGISVHEGIENTKAIRKAGQDKLRIAAVAAMDSPDLQLAVRIAGADRVLLKPLFQSTVFNLMMELTGREYTHITTKPDDYDFSGCRILFAEDNDLNAQITSTQLEAVGICANRADNGADCIEIFRSAKIGYYDLIILDMRMPVMDGLSAAIKLRNSNIPGADRIPIIALTADALATDITDAFDAGMNDYVIKPIDSYQLYSTLAKYISKKQ